MKISRSVVIGTVLILVGIILLSVLIVSSTSSQEGKETFGKYYFSESITGTNNNNEEIQLRVIGRIDGSKEMIFTVNFEAPSWHEAEYRLVIFTSKEWAGFGYEIEDVYVDIDKPFVWELKEFWYPNSFFARQWIQGTERICNFAGNSDGIIGDFSYGEHPLKAYILGRDTNSGWMTYLYWDGTTLHKKPYGESYELYFSGFGAQPAWFKYSDDTFNYTFGGLAICFIIAGAIFILYKEEK